MSVGDSRCDECQSKECQACIVQIAGARFCLCRRCVGKAVAAMVGWLRDFDRLHPKLKRPRNSHSPIVDLSGTARCRVCEVQLEDWQPGASPFCSACISTSTAP